MKYVAPLICAALGVFVIFSFMGSTETYKEWHDPCGYWQGQLARRNELLVTYDSDARSCPAKLRELQANRNLWIKQKTLEGMTATEGAKDFDIALSSQQIACEFAVSMVTGGRNSAREAIGKVQLLCSKK